MKRQGPSTTAPPESNGGTTSNDHLHLGHPYQTVVDGIFRVALRGLPGPWDVRAQALGRAWFRIDVVAPDGARWFMSVPVFEGPCADDLADTVRAACSRHCRLHGENVRRRARSLGDCATGSRDVAPTASSPRGEVAAMSSPTDAKGRSE
jgi:hypothetical protein